MGDQCLLDTVGTYICFNCVGEEKNPSSWFDTEHFIFLVGQSVWALDKKRNPVRRVVATISSKRRGLEIRHRVLNAGYLLVELSHDVAVVSRETENNPIEDPERSDRQSEGCRRQNDQA